MVMKDRGAVGQLRKRRPGSFGPGPLGTTDGRAGRPGSFRRGGAWAALLRDTRGGISSDTGEGWAPTLTTARLGAGGRAPGARGFPSFTEPAGGESSGGLLGFRTKWI